MIQKEKLFSCMWHILMRKILFDFFCQFLQNASKQQVTLVLLYVADFDVKKKILK